MTRNKCQLYGNLTSDIMQETKKKKKYLNISIFFISLNTRI